MLTSRDPFRFMRRLGLGLIALGLLVALGGQADADPVIWYNGDFDGANALANGINTLFFSQSNVYDDFVVTSTTTITTVFSNNLMMDFTASTASWEIRSGVSLNDSGTLVASGTDAATQTPTGRSGFDLTEYTVSVTGLDITLAPGIYWLTVVPVGSGDGSSFVSTTSGANAVGAPPGNDGNSFLNSSDFFENFGNPSDLLDTGVWDFSMGVEGVPSAAAEPATLVLLGSGLAGLGTTVWRRTRRK